MWRFVQIQWVGRVMSVGTLWVGVGRAKDKVLRSIPHPPDPHWPLLWGSWTQLPGPLCARAALPPSPPAHDPRGPPSLGPPRLSFTTADPRVDSLILNSTISHKTWEPKGVQRSQAPAFLCLITLLFHCDKLGQFERYFPFWSQIWSRATSTHSQVWGSHQPPWQADKVVLHLYPSYLWGR